MTQMPIFVLFVSWSLILGCFFPVSILKVSVVYTNLGDIIATSGTVNAILIRYQIKQIRGRFFSESCTNNSFPKQYPQLRDPNSNFRYKFLVEVPLIAPVTAIQTLY